MYIEPNSTIRLFHNVPLEPDYENTILFESISDQTAYFSASSNHHLATLSNQYYQRVERGYCRIKRPIKDVLDCNYMCFKNTSFTEAYYDKWFYAFVTSVEYINNEVTQIQYSIDVMQTYMFDVELLESYVEREHVNKADDTIGVNIEPEPMQLTEYVANGNRDNLIPSLTNNLDYCVIIMVNDEDKSQASLKNMHCGLYSGLLLFSYKCSDTQGIQSLIDAYIQTPDNIVAMYFCPQVLLPSAPAVGGAPRDHLMGSTTVFTKIQDYAGTAVSPADALDGYTPRNNKLYTYPFNYYQLYTGDGNGMTVRYEFFDNLTPTFTFMGTYLQPIECRLYPANYKNVGTLLTESLSITNYPQLAWAVDAFKSWISREWLPIILSAGSIALNTVPGLAGASSMYPLVERGEGGRFVKGTQLLNTETGDIVSRQRSGGYKIAQEYNAMKSGADFASATLQDFYSASIQANMTKGSISGSTTALACDIQGFFGQRFSISHNSARRIDDFFTRYGYATHQMKIPRRNGRVYFNYLKTSQVNIHVLPLGICQSSDLEIIKGIYNRGITFWHDPDQCGNYTQQIMDNN